MDNMMIELFDLRVLPRFRGVVMHELRYCAIFLLCAPVMLYAQQKAPVITRVAANSYAAYDDSWYQVEHWSGEWPNGFSVARPGIVVQSRAAMDQDARRSIACTLPFKAVFSPWNSARNELSDVH